MKDILKEIDCIFYKNSLPSSIIKDSFINYIKNPIGHKPYIDDRVIFNSADKRKLYSIINSRQRKE